MHGVTLSQMTDKNDDDDDDDDGYGYNNACGRCVQTWKEADDSCVSRHSRRGTDRQWHLFQLPRYSVDCPRIVLTAHV